MTKDGVLELELCDEPTPGEQPDEAEEQEVGEDRKPRGMLPASVNQGGPSFGAPQAGLDNGHVVELIGNL
jgi:hypothetical protein